MNTRLQVLVTGARAPVTLHVCRLLNQSGAEVYATDCTSTPLTKASNSIKQFILTPSPKFETKLYIKALVELIKKERINYLIPICEEIFYISKYKDELNQYCEVLVDDFSKLQSLHNKYKFIKMVDSLGFQVPRTAMLSEKTMNKKWFKNNHLVMKKIFSRFSDSVIFLPSIDDIPSTRFDESSWILQERIKGDQYCSYSIAKNGKVLAHSVYKSNFTAGLGATLSFKHTDRHDIYQFVCHIVEHLNFTGQISFDFIVDECNKAYPIECNPRTTSGLHLFDQDVVKALLLQSNNCLTPLKKKKEAIKLVLFLYGLQQVKNIRKFGEWLKIIATYKDITLRTNDPLPYFYQIISLIKLWRDSKKNAVTLLQQSTYDISWDGDDI
ncbi:ATP-grasp domain-containing protein [Metabacillus niabensis]|uniref:ATP-grasp domain-containing protein n=1 Tax=Metabacillus niabensis TaxID=324854 RepID=UPI001CF98070|nr:ATP-grasp domain-containing protein [Metabacillus niabensis]